MLIPLRDHIIVVAQDDPDVWAGSSIIRPESTKDRSDQGWVKSIGPEVKEVEVGDYVMFSPYSGVVADVEGEGDKLIMIREVGVIAIITPPTTIVDGLFVKLESGEYVPAPSETVSLLLRMTYHRIPRVAEIRSKGINL